MSTQTPGKTRQERKTADGYTRLSQTSSVSIQNQKEYIQHYFADADDVELAAIYDDGELQSGFDTTGRTEYHKLVDKVNNAESDIIAAIDNKRFARDFDDTMQLVIDCRKNDVEMHVTGPGDNQYPDGKLDLDDPIHAAVELLLAAAAEKDKQQEIERAVNAIEKKIEAGYYHGEPPKGLTYSNCKRYLVPDPNDDWDEVVHVIDLRGQGMTYRDIERETGIPKSTAADICDRVHVYQSAAERAGYNSDILEAYHQ